MSENKEDIWELIDGFRSSEYYKDVVWQNFGVIHASLEMNELLVKSLDEFRDKFPAFLHKYTMIQEKTYGSILSKMQKAEKFQNALRKIFNEHPNPDTNSGPGQTSGADGIRSMHHSLVNRGRSEVCARELEDTPMCFTRADSPRGRFN